MKQKAEYRMGVGASSILMMLVVLAMAALSVLSLYSARQSDALARRNLAMTVSYYQAAAEAQQKLFALDALLASPGTAALDAAGWNAVLGENGLSEITVAENDTFTLEVDAGAQRALRVEGTLRPGRAPRYTVTVHRLVNRASNAAETPLELYVP